LAKSKVRPKRSMLFVWHTGEEKGLWGSAYFTDHPTVPRDSIVAQLKSTRWAAAPRRTARVRVPAARTG
jgi:protocatechuate 3,4-dioxygenase beta subunit